MEKQFYTPDELVKKLVDLTGLNQKELAERLGMTPQTLSNWSVGRTKYFDPKLISSIGDAMRQNPRWGIRMGTITRSKIEIIENKTSDHNNDDQLTLANDVIRNQLSYISELKTELEKLREQIEQYKSK